VTLGKTYRQEGALTWGYLTPPDEAVGEHVLLTQRPQRTRDSRTRASRTKTSGTKTSRTKTSRTKTSGDDRAGG
jgi:hypothetical protein